jgi:hypothetical protein
MSEPDKKGEKAKKEWHPGDTQRFIMGLLFLLPFDVLIIIIAIRIWFLDITISVDSFDLQILLTILLTALVGIVNSAAAFYFTSKAAEKARAPA